MPQHPTRHHAPAHQRCTRPNLQLEWFMPGDTDGPSDLLPLTCAGMRVFRVEHDRLAPLTPRDPTSPPSTPRHSSTPPTLPAVSRATARAPIRFPLHSSASVPSRSCRRSRASLGHRTGSIAGRSLGGASPRPRAQFRSTSPARCAGHAEHGHTRASSTRRSRVLPAGAGRFGRAWTTRSLDLSGDSLPLRLPSQLGQSRSKHRIHIHYRASRSYLTRKMLYSTPGPPIIRPCPTKTPC